MPDHMHADTHNSNAPVFSGNIPKHYDDHLGPLFFEPYAIEIAGRVAGLHAQVVLELASGTGRVTRHLREVLPPSTRFIASDISPDMLSVAREKLKDANIDWQVIDAQQLPFKDETIDLVVCCFGYMFVPDKIKAFREACRVLRPGGSLLMTTWDKIEYNGASDLYRTIVKKYLTQPLPELYGFPFSMHEETTIRQFLQDAGFSGISIERSVKNAVCDSAGLAAKALAQGGTIHTEIVKRNPAWVKEITVELEKQLADTFGDRPMISPMSALICQALK